MSYASRAEERDARAEAAELTSRPNLRTVVDRFIEAASSMPPGERRNSIERAAGCLEVGLRDGEDITAEERDKWLEALARG